MSSHLSHPVINGGDATPVSGANEVKAGKKRGSYNCGRCGLPKKGHTCHLPRAAGNVLTTPASTPSTDSTTSPVVISSPSSTARPVLLHRLSRQTGSNLRRALSFDEDIEDSDFRELDEQLQNESDTELDLSGSGKLPMACLWEIFTRLPPSSLMSASGVCKGWRETSKRVWKAAEELILRVPAKTQIGCFGSMLQKCPGLVRLSLTMESDVDSTMLAWIAFSCPNLKFMEIFTSKESTNRITGDELGRFVADRRYLTTLKMEGCSNFGSLVLSSTSLSMLWLSDLHCLSKMIFNCPNLKEISLDFSRQGNDSTDLAVMMNGFGRSCPKLQNLHVASVWLSHAAVLALTDANLSGLRMLSLVLGSEITDASVAAIASSYSNLELLDLSGSSISDSGLGMICNVFPDTLCRLLVALCPNITSSGIQFAAAQLPLLELMDCGMSIYDPNSDLSSTEENSVYELQKTPKGKVHIIYQKLIIKHSRLKKLSLWGCSGLDALYLNCPELDDLNLNTCSNLHPERLLLQCPNLKTVHASGCQEMLVDTIQNQVSSGDSGSLECTFLSKRLPDGSKRVRVPCLNSQPSSNEKEFRRDAKRHCVVLSN